MSQMTFARDERPEDLVLKHFRKPAFDWTEYSNFLEQLCKDREYQKQAIIAAVNLYLGKKYKNTRELAEENFDQNPKIQELHDSKNQYINQFEFPDKLCSTIDLATGTGKSWVMYGVAQIMLCEGVVDYVLVLVPTITIEKQLKQKFKDFASDGKLKKTLPAKAKYRNPRITSAGVTLMPGDICVENDEAILEHVKSSSILTSLEGQGQRTLIINDEAHHLISDEKNVTKWNQFVSSNKYNFKYVLNSTGTPYKGNNYFRDVIFRYSIRKAIDEGFIKDIKYLTEDEGKGKDKLSLIYTIHQDNKKSYLEIKKPLTIFVTGKIDAAVDAADEFKKYLKKKGISQDEADKQVLVVSSRGEHKDNVSILEKVDIPENPVEWIFSVSMLSEGWDVKNVFQIVPHEERAFSSKLLISQVLGRGLRIPTVYETGEKQPIVTITNHDAWSRNIASYVDAIAEINRLASYPIKKKPDYNFDIYWADASKEIKLASKKVEKGKIELPKSLGFKHQIAVREANFKEVKEGRTDRIEYEIELNAQSAGDVATQIYTKLGDYDKTNGTDFSKKVTIEELKELIKKELKGVGAEDLDSVSDENRQRALHSFDVLYRQETGTSVVKIKYNEPIKKNTRDIQKVYVSTRSMDEFRAIVYEKNSVESSEDDDKKAIISFYKSPHRFNGSVIIVDDPKNYKCPQNIVHARQTSEIDFVSRLIEPKNAKNIDAWVKVPDQSFYEIEYSYKPGTHSLTRYFNPDFLINKRNLIIVVEIKQDGDDNKQNVAKNKFAEKYFKELNEKLGGKQEYLFTFLSPEDYMAFFKFLETGKPKPFVSALQADLRKKQEEEKDEKEY